jgi:hypothetical protein
MKEQLTLEHLAPYLPYGVKIAHGLIIKDLTAVSLDSPFVFCTTYLSSRVKTMINISDIKPILRPLSDLTKEIEVDGEEFIPIDYIGLMDYDTYSLLYIQNHTYRLPYQIFNKLLSWHFDIFGLIQKNLAIDINTLE